MLRLLRASACALAAFVSSGVVLAQTPARPSEKVRVTYAADPGCPDSNAFLTQVRARVGVSWEAPPNELARTIEVRVSGGSDRNVARIDFVDENNQPITRIVTAKTCDEVVTGIALVTALAIESRIAEAVGRSEPATATASPSPPATPAPEEPKAPAAPPVPAPSPAPAPPPAASRGQPPHYDVGGGVLASVGALPGVAIGARGFLGIGWSGGPDLRLGGDFVSSGTVTKTVNGQTYDSRFRLTSARLSACPLAFGDSVRLLPCGGVEVGVMKAEGVASAGPGELQVAGAEASPPPVWVAPFVSVRADATWEVFFAELEVAVAFPVSPTDRDFIFQRATAAGQVPDKVHTIWPASPGASLSVGLRL